MVATSDPRQEASVVRPTALLPGQRCVNLRRNPATEKVHAVTSKANWDSGKFTEHLLPVSPPPAERSVAGGSTTPGLPGPLRV